MNQPLSDARSLGPLLQRGPPGHRLAAYIAMGIATIHQRVAFRTAFFLGLGSQILAVMSLLYLWRAVYGNQGTGQAMAGYTWDGLRSYLLLTFWLQALIGWQSEMSIAGRIQDGSIAVDLLKPLDFQTARCSEVIGGAVFEGTCAGVVVLALALAIGGVAAVAGLFAAPPLAILLGVASSFLALLLKFGVVYLACLLGFWTTSVWGISWARAAITQLLSGALVPLTFLPVWIQDSAAWLPFAGMNQIPLDLWLGRVTGTPALHALLTQVAWVAGLWLVGRFFGTIAMRKVVIHGG